MSTVFSGRRTSVVAGAVAIAVIVLSALTLLTGVRSATAATNPCGVLWTDASPDASDPTGSQSDALDIVAGNLSNSATALTTTLTIANLQQTLANGATANEYYFVWTSGGTTYFTDVEYSPATGVQYSYGHKDATTGSFTGDGTATGSFNTGKNGTVVATVPLSAVGSPAAGSLLTAIEGDTYALEGVPSNPSGVSGGSLQTVDHDGAAADYALGQTCSPTPTPSGGAPSPSPSPTAPPCSKLCFSNPLVLPASGVTGSTSATCYNPCGEPSMAVSPVDGTVYVSTPRTIVICCNSQASPVWKSGDDGRTWSQPIFPSAPENATTGGDTELAIDKRGTVYEGELWLGSDSIYVSPDKGSTWSWSPASHDVGADREWFTYAPAEDALYGFYDGFKGLMVVKAPLTTPAGSNAALFFPLERVVVPECPDLVSVGQCAVTPSSAGGTPVLDGDVSPGRPSIAPNGTLYFPFPYEVAGQGVGVAYTSDGGQSYQYTFVKGAGGGTLGDTGHDFPVSAVDSAGTLYISWVENKGDGFNVYLSSFKGGAWSSPLEVSKGVSATAVFPQLVAGAPGQVAVSWYGTAAKGDPNTVSPSASWNVYTTQVLGADRAGSSLITSTVQTGFHSGP
ncbi:MAG TPA: hypothetical protein VKX24_10915, partial [Acidimicrobiia bacterium]|nr:hypothetical protein [Acidimicrobiia bacterium]